MLTFHKNLTNQYFKLYCADWWLYTLMIGKYGITLCLLHYEWQYQIACHFNWIQPLQFNGGNLTHVVS